MQLLLTAYDDCDGASGCSYALLKLTEKYLERLEGRLMLARGVKSVDECCFSIEFASAAVQWYSATAFDLTDDQDDEITEHEMILWEGPDPSQDPLPTSIDIVACWPNGDVVWRACLKHGAANVETGLLSVSGIREMFPKIFPPKPPEAT